MAAKIGIATVCAIRVECPYCGDGVRGPIYDSFMIDEEECSGGRSGICDGCGAEVKLPRFPVLDRRLARSRKA